MSEHKKLLGQILRGTADANIPFDGLCRLLRSLDFDERIRGSHHIFAKEGVVEMLQFAAGGCG